MAVNSEYYMHDSDRKALQALKAIPGFTPLLKAFMKIWNEKQFRIQNMSSNIRIDQRQLKKYHDMLPPICEKLGIDVPELYLTLDVVPNAYTYGDTKPFIVMTSGLLETLPEELIPTVLAHECGHIACHHCLYTTMGNMILNGAAAFLGLSQLVTLPLQVAFYYWMRCSEYSADRAAAIYDGGAEKIVEMCMRFSGLDKDLGLEADRQAFMDQAIEYKQMIDDSKWNKTLEFLILSQADHPLNAVRAYECNQWTKGPQFRSVAGTPTPLPVPQAFAWEEPMQAGADMIEMPRDSSFYTGRNCHEVMIELYEIGFPNVVLRMRPVDPSAPASMDDTVVVISVDGKEGFQKGDRFPKNAKIVIHYQSF